MARRSKKDTATPGMDLEELSRRMSSTAGRRLMERLAEAGWPATQPAREAAEHRRGDDS